MAIIAKPLVLLCAGVAAVHAASPKEAKAPEAKPLISTDLLYATYDILVVTGTTVWQKAGADAMLAKAVANVPMDDIQKKGLELKKLALEKTGPLPPWVDTASLQAQATYVQVRALVTENVDKVTEPAQMAAVKVIEQFEKVAPKHKGLIPKTAGNLALFVVYAFGILSKDASGDKKKKKHGGAENNGKAAAVAPKAAAAKSEPAKAARAVSKKKA